MYALKDPRDKEPKPFYIGKGTGNRAWEHQSKVDDSEKGRLIQSILDDGRKVVHTIIAEDLTEVQSLRLEAELISAFGIRSRGGFLLNKVKPSLDKFGGKVKKHMPDGCHERAQLGLELLNSSILEFMLVNPDGVTNADVAKYLGLQSHYRGGSKDYLSFSLLGNLMNDGQVKRPPKGRKYFAVKN